jgi:hypothetical protein
MIDRGKSGRPTGAPYNHYLTEPDTHYLASITGWPRLLLALIAGH